MQTLSAVTIVTVLSGCSTLPRDGPTGKAVESGATTPVATGSFTIVDLNYETSQRIKSRPAGLSGSLAGGDSQATGGLIGPGDALAISVYEPSGSLFSSGGSGGSSSNSRSGSNVRSGSQSLPGVVVDRGGTVTVPFAGPVQVAGLTSSQAAAAIRQALRGKAVNPQVIVSVAENSYNTVTVLGEVKQPGRVPLSTNADGILDVIAASGGAARNPEDLEVVIQRNGQTFKAPLSAVTSQFGENIRLARGDQVNLVYHPRRFSTFGALGAVAEAEMGAGPLDLAGAISKVGGLDTNSANARSVLVFRFERPEVAEALGLQQPATPNGVPVVYRLDLENPAGFFTARNFEVQPGDILYVPRSGSAELSKFFTLIQTVTRVVYDVSVTRATTAD